ncbi:TonB-dependent receptor [Lysobacter sp. BMK333-48F3]|uniref:TonB-dependent receptor family protein n=1 Tax=Lysobacter sp. BMK333-48F3 TaxID=2867962 RepID=UPI001C8C19CF|nr:TonB-dependent receptor [Lysobacter sp. BMK333-48F3]MBX9399712.1 TonB-dependent receptor [Lysobacter sp. BMK333-48F3]
MRQRSLRSPLLAIAIAFAFDAAAQTQDAPGGEPATLETVRVRGPDRPRTVDSLEAARARLDQRAGATALVDGESYRDRRVGTLADALGYAPGVFVQPRFGAEEARLSIRGSGLQRTFHGRGLELLQDGSPLNLADGGFDFQSVDPLAARYIEVYRGANALEYGAATLGGAIDFVSPTGYDTAPLTLRAEAGAFGHRRGQLALAGVSGRADAYLSLGGSRQDGFRDHAAQENYRWFGNAGYRFGERLDGRVYLTHVDTRSALPGSLTLAEARRDPALAAPAALSQNQRRDYRLDRLAARLSWTPSATGTLNLSAYYADKSLDHPIFQVLRQDSRDLGLDLRWRGEGRWFGRRNLLVAGLAWAQGEIDDRRYFNLAGQAGAPSNRFDQRAVNRKLYLENQTWLTPAWVVSLGAQALDAKRRSRDRLIVGGRDESFAADYSGISPKLGLRYLIDDRAQLYANLSRSLEPPSFGELSGGPGISPVGKQRADSAELGLRLDRAALSLDLALYRARLRGELLSLSDGQGNPLGTINAGRTLHQGVELGLGWRIGEAWTVSANYLYNDFRFHGDRVYGDNDLAGVAPQLLRAELRWSPDPRLYIAPNLEWTPQDTWIDHANSYRAPGYRIVGLRLGGRAAPHWSWFADARNLGDRRWIASSNVIADARGQDGRNFLPGDGRAVYVGVEWRD